MRRQLERAPCTGNPHHTLPALVPMSDCERGFGEAEVVPTAQAGRQRAIDGQRVQVSRDTGCSASNGCQTRAFHATAPAFRRCIAPRKRRLTRAASPTSRPCQNVRHEDRQSAEAGCKSDERCRCVRKMPPSAADSLFAVRQAGVWQTRGNVTKNLDLSRRFCDQIQPEIRDK